MPGRARLGGGDDELADTQIVAGHADRDVRTCMGFSSCNDVSSLGGEMQLCVQDLPGTLLRVHPGVSMSVTLWHE